MSIALAGSCWRPSTAFHEDGTFDAVRVHDPHYMGAVTRQLTTTKEELALTRTELDEVKRELAALLSKADRDELPTLFVEGKSDEDFIAAAWSVFYPGEAMPFKVIAAEGTPQMRPLAAPGKTLRSVIGDRLLLALADNDGAGRKLWPDKRVHMGGSWRQQTNGVWWRLLRPSDEFREVMTRFKIDAAYWPFTIENAFPAALRQQALAEGAYAFANTPQADLLEEQSTAHPRDRSARRPARGRPSHFCLLRPTSEAKDTFAAWITEPTRLTRENYAAFEPILTGLRDLVERHTAARAAADPPRQRGSCDVFVMSIRPSQGTCRLAADEGCDAGRHPLRCRLDRVGSQVGVASRGLHLRVTEQLADHGQALAEGHGA